VLNLLLREIPQPFGILDFDCFVFRPDYLHAVDSMGPRTSVQAFFANHDQALDLWIPQTYLLNLNQPVLAELMMRYRVGTNSIFWDDLSPIVQRRLATLGIGPNRIPENKPGFDTLRVLLLLALADGYPFEFIARQSDSDFIGDDLFHVGASSDPRKILGASGIRQFWSSYFWIRRLELIEDAELRDRYLARFGFGSSEDVLGRFPRRPRQETLDFMDRLAAGKLDCVSGKRTDVEAKM
jgi:hypothetical protein